MAHKVLKALEAECVIFDLDGTLVDTAPDLLETLNVLMASLGRRKLELEEVRHAVGGGAKALIRNGAMLTGEALDEDEIERLFGQYLDHYSANIAVKTRPFPGAREVLDTLKAAGVKMAVCTNKLESLTREVLEALNLTAYFDVIIASDTLGTMKPDPAGVFEILRRCGASPEKTLYIGDSKTDLEAARGAGVAIVLVDFGYTLVPARQLGADAVISDLREVLDAL